MRYTRRDEIAASPRNVWAVLIDIERWPEWSASMQQVTRLEPGPLRVGSTARVQQPKVRPTVWTVTELAHQRSFTWTASSPGIRLTGYHEITPTACGVSAVLTFAITGPLARIAGLLGGSRIRSYVDMEAEGLKQRAELRGTK